jgi:hypothetical protein
MTTAQWRQTQRNTPHLITQEPNSR